MLKVNERYNSWKDSWKDYVIRRRIHQTVSDWELLLIPTTNKHIILKVVVEGSEEISSVEMKDIKKKTRKIKADKNGMVVKKL